MFGTIWLILKQTKTRQQKRRNIINNTIVTEGKKVAPCESLGLHSCTEHINGIPTADYNQQKRSHYPASSVMFPNLHEIRLRVKLRTSLVMSDWHS